VSGMWTRLLVLSGTLFELFTAGVYEFVEFRLYSQLVSVRCDTVKHAK